MPHYRVYQEQCNFEGGSQSGKCQCNCMSEEGVSQWFSAESLCSNDQQCWGSMECESICNQYNHAPIRSLPGRQRRGRPYTPGRGRGYNRGGRVNTTNNRSRWSGRTQNNPKGRPKK